MMIPVIYLNGRHDLVKDFMLSRMIDNQEIVRFKRSEGWVDITSGKIRRSGGRGHYLGAERRRNEHNQAEELADIF